MADSSLAGRRIVVTRPAAQAGPLVDLLEDAGASGIVVPLIEIADDRAGMEQLRALDPTTFEWVIVTSRNAALRLMDAHGELLGDLDRDRSRPSVAAIGTATAALIVGCRLVPEVQSAAGLLAEMPEASSSASALVVHAVDAEPDLADGLQAAGWMVTVVAPYRSVPATLTARQQLGALAADAVLFASGSAARAWVELFGTTTPPVVVAIGPQTARAATAVGLKVDAVATDHSVQGLLDALKRTFGVSN